MSTQDNVDLAELDKFASAAHQWWDPEGAFKSLHRINPLRLGWIESQCPPPLQGKRIVDVGCGGGILAEALARKGADVLGIDLVDKSLKAAKLHALEAQIKNLDYRLVSAEELARECEGQFDAVTCMEMLEHVSDPASVIRACARLTRPGGTVFFSTINRNPKAYLLAIVAAEHLLALVPKGTHNYARLLRPSQLAAMGRDAALIPRAFKGLQYNPVTRRFWLSDDLSVNYMLAMDKPALQA
ncbi:MAG: bifunctional 2-polyprenyl-6-hydroxyphenol methylase/3-demethylubiquinol 3-O-methyltransferase UbiG [Burkholderiaceae bacterium]|jgi:2-polyprenyl-6-hydroxyphenyl methylase/3-demethylubiquinone-9 3-methyltransferase|nr:bifunctional 2-polyprenyl-6-hydroxyphenol methylase/3-demethylubiquinol 3-O-methyltransferase UbiG [Burkholderiaceae bacterium]